MPIRFGILLEYFAPTMPRKPIELSDRFPYHVCARSNNRDWFDLPLSKVFGIYANLMHETVKRYAIQCHAFVLMANHFHALVSTPQSNLSQAMRYFMTETSRAIARRTNRINRIYGARYSWTIIREGTHYAHAFFYVYRNPIKHGAVQNVEDYRWSTLHPYHRKFSNLIQSKEGFDEHIPASRKECVGWINQVIDSKYEEGLQKAMRRREFRFPRDRNGTNRPTFNNMLRPKKSPGT